MTTHHNQDNELPTPEDSNSPPISTTDTTAEAAEEETTAEVEQSTKRPTVSLSQGPPHVKVNASSSQEQVKVKLPLLGLALSTSGISLGVLGCGLTLAKGPFGDLASYLEPLAQRGLTGGSMILTGMVLTAMSLVERQLRKQTQSLEVQEGNATILQDIFGSMASITSRLDALQAGKHQVYAETNMMRNELHQYITGQEGKDEQTGIFHVAASVDKLSANVDKTLKRFGSDLEGKLASVREEAQVTNQKLEAKLQELEPQEIPDNSELIAAQADIAERLQGLESNLMSTRTQLGEVGDCVHSSVQNIMQEKLSELQPQETYDDSAVLAGQSELSDRLCTLEASIHATQEHVSGLDECIQGAVNESLSSMPTAETYDDSAMLAGQEELADRMGSIEENLRSAHAEMGECVQSAVQESIQGLPQQETHDDSALLANQSEIAGRLEALENHLENTRTRFSEAQNAVQASAENLSQNVQETVDARIEELRTELEQVCSAVESAVQSAVESGPVQQPIIFEAIAQDEDCSRNLMASGPGVQTWAMDDSHNQPAPHRVQENPPLEILHMPTEEELASIVNTKQEELAHSLDHLFHPIPPTQEDETRMVEESFQDSIPQPHDPNQNSAASHGTPENPTPFLSSKPNLIPGTPGSPFPAPVPLKPTDSDNDVAPPTEGSSEFQNPYEPPSDDTGFRFPGWN